MFQCEVTYCKHYCDEEECRCELPFTTIELGDTGTNLVAMCSDFEEVEDDNN